MPDIWNHAGGRRLGERDGRGGVGVGGGLRKKQHLIKSVFLGSKWGSSSIKSRATRDVKDLRVRP